MFNKKDEQWAKGVIENGTPRQVYSGKEAAAESRKLLVEVLGSSEALDNLIGGRPSLDPNAKHGQHSKTLGIRFPENEIVEIEKVAAEKGVNKSVIIRQAVKEYLHQKAS